MSTKLESDFRLLPADAVEHPAHSAFVAAMDGRAYGEGPLTSAWHWFKDGYDQLRADLEAANRLVTEAQVRSAAYDNDRRELTAKLEAAQRTITTLGEEARERAGRLEEAERLLRMSAGYVRDDALNAIRTKRLRALPGEIDAFLASGSSTGEAAVFVAGRDFQIPGPAAPSPAPASECPECNCCEEAPCPGPHMACSSSHCDGDGSTLAERTAPASAQGTRELGQMYQRMDKLEERVTLQATTLRVLDKRVAALEGWAVHLARKDETLSERFESHVHPHPGAEPEPPQPAPVERHALESSAALREVAKTHIAEGDGERLRESVPVERHRFVAAIYDRSGSDRDVCRCGQPRSAAVHDVEGGNG